MSDQKLKTTGISITRGKEKSDIFTIKAKVRVNGRQGKVAVPVLLSDLSHVLIPEATRKIALSLPGEKNILKPHQLNKGFLEAWKNMITAHNKQKENTHVKDVLPMAYTTKTSRSR